MYLLEIMLLCVSCGGEFTSDLLRDHPGGLQLFLDIFPILTPETKDPININPKNATDVDMGGFEPLTLRARLTDEVEVRNNGKIGNVTGGVLGDDMYLFKEIKYLWTDDINGIAATTVNKKGYPFENVAMFYNKKYGSFENALNYRDGIAEVDFSIGICDIPNLLFEKYAPILKQVQKAGSMAHTDLGTAISWFAVNSLILPIDSYYSYPGSYVNKTRNERYYSAIVIILPHVLGMCITPQQFKETFGSFKTSSGQPFTNRESQFPQTMPVVRATGIVNFNTL